MRRLGVALALAVVLVAAALLIGNKNRPAVLRPDKLNVVLISVDSVRADHMGLFGYGRDTTPNIDAWAKDGIVFGNNFSTSFLTPISEMSVHTGNYPFTSGVINFQSVLRDSVPTMAQIFKSNGMQTAAFLSSPEFYNYPALKAGFTRGFDTYVLSSASDTKYYQHGGNPVADAIAWIDGHNREQFFLWVAIGSAHWPYGQDEPNHFSDPAYDGFLNTDDVKRTGMTWRDNLGFAYRGVLYSTTTPVRSVGSVGKEDIDYVNGRYDDGLVLTDRIVGELFDYIKKTGLADRTVVILQSEHGETLGERGYIAHYDIYDETVHTPLIIKMPALAGRRIETLTSGVDVLPTVLSLLRIPAPVVDGVDLSPFFTGATSTQPRREVYLSRTPLWERLFSSTFQGRAIFLPSSMPIESTAWAQFVTADNKEHYYDTAIRTEKWKLIHRLARTALLKYSWWGWLTGKPVVLPEYELYDLANDPGETRNIYSAHAHDADIVALRAKLEDWEVKMRGATPGPTPVQEIQPYF